ncbi:MAG: hypothetical protein GXW85_05215 [Clostridia bacterium]|nr:hypothetical protein [Clostridia bacterium]
MMKRILIILSILIFIASIATSCGGSSKKKAAQINIVPKKTVEIVEKC